MEMTKPIKTLFDEIPDDIAKTMSVHEKLKWISGCTAVTLNETICGIPLSRYVVTNEQLDQLIQNTIRWAHSSREIK